MTGTVETHALVCSCFSVASLTPGEAGITAVRALAVLLLPVLSKQGNFEKRLLWVSSDQEPSVSSLIFLL